jgi:aspartyl-tRNA(Asn)/glutamyl-tRNA(Gln) amidotransferase subunit A
MIAFASSLDQAGVFTRSVTDAALMLEAICGYDAKDSTSTNKEVPEFAKAVGGDIKGMKVGIPKEYTQDGMPPEIEKLWQQGIEWMKGQGAEIVDISLPHTKYALPTYYIIAPAEASANLSRYDGVRYGLRVFEKGMSLDDMYEATRSEGFGDEVKRRLMIGTYVLSAGYYDAYYRQAQQVRTKLISEFADVFSKYDAVMSPTAPSTAFKIGKNTKDPLEMYLTDVMTVAANLTGIPAISLPSGFDAELPIGLQLMAKQHADIDLLCLANTVEGMLV